MSTPEEHKPPCEYVKALCEDGRTPGDREIALATAFALPHIADSLPHVANGVAHHDEYKR